jgi:hypothetical protein
MGAFESSRLFPQKPTSLAPIAQDVMDHFERKGFEVTGEEILAGAWDISIHKGETFKAIFGLKLALKISIEPRDRGTFAKASVGV